MKDKILAAALIILTILICLSCSVIKNASTNKTDSHTKTDTDSVATVNSKVDTRITEQIDTAVTFGGERIEGAFLTGGLTVDSDWPFTLEDDNQKITIDHGKVIGVVKPKTIHVNFKKVTETKAQIQSTGHERKKSNERVDVKIKASEVKRTGVPWLWLLLLVIGVSAWLVWKFYLSKIL
jgi:hypothetical protein